MSRAEPMPAVPVSPPVYEHDFFAWTQHMAALLRAGRFGELDVEHLAEEVEDMGKRDRRAVESRLEVLLARLLEWQHQAPRRCGSWRASIRAQRSRLELVLRDSPSLRAQFPAMLARRYPKAVAVAVDETGLPSERFPDECAYTAEELLDEGFFPE